MSTVQSPRVLKIILFANVVMTLIPAVMVSINMHEFEILAHELEYCAEITMSFLELVLLKSLLSRNAILGGAIQTEKIDDEENRDTDIDINTNINMNMDTNINGNSLMLATISVAIALTQLSVYNGMGKSPTGDMLGETPAHYCEFLFEFLSSIITCWFAMDNMFTADEELSTILFGDHADCKICATHAPVPLRNV